MQRITRSRFKPYPKDIGEIVTVSRYKGSVYGNPHKVVNGNHFEVCVKHAKDLIEMYHNGTLKEFVAPLQGKNLACWCKQEEYCHADTLLLVANYYHAFEEILKLGGGSYDIVHLANKLKRTDIQEHNKSLLEYYIDFRSISYIEKCAMVSIRSQIWSEQIVTPNNEA